MKQCNPCGLTTFAERTLTHPLVTKPLVLINPRLRIVNRPITQEEYLWESILESERKLWEMASNALSSYLQESYRKMFEHTQLEQEHSQFLG